MTRFIAVLAIAACAAFGTLPAQSHDLSGQRDAFRHTIVRGGKWLTAFGAVTFTVLAQREHNQSRHVWNSLLDICHSSQDACALGPDGRYVRSDAEQLYQRSRAFDRRANRWLFGAQASLLVSTSLFIIDLHPGDGPGNIPYPAVQVGMKLKL